MRIALTMNKAVYNSSGVGPVYSKNTPISGTGYAFRGHSLSFPTAACGFAYVTPGTNIKLELTTFTVEGWAYFTGTNYTQAVFAYEPAGAHGYGTGYSFGLSSDGRVFFRIGDGAKWSFVYSNSILQANRWYHIAGSYSYNQTAGSATMKVFVNGVEENVQNNVGLICYSDFANQGPNPKTAYLGVEHNGYCTSPTYVPDLIYLIGQGSMLDRIRIHDTALTASELDYWYQGEEWENNSLGITDEVPPPWTAMTVEGNTINCWGRQITTGATQIASQIVSQNASLLERPIQLWAIVNGQTTSWVPASTVFESISASKVVYKTSASSATSTLQTRVSVEYDGMMKVECRIIPSGTINVSRLCLDISMPVARAKYLLTARHVYLEYVQGLLPSNGYTSRFHPYVWLSDDDRGLCWFCETDDGWAPTGSSSAVQVIRNGSTNVTLRLNIIDTSTILSQPFKLTFGLHPTPVKPMPTSWRTKYRWINTYCLDRYNLFPNLPQTWDTYWLNNLTNPQQKQGNRANAVPYWPHPLSYKYFGFPEANNPDTTRLLVDFYHNKGIKLLPYVAANELCNKLPEYTKHQDDWILAGDVTGGDVKEFGNDVTINLISPLSRGWPDYFLYKTCNFIEGFNFDGIYSDWSEVAITYMTKEGKEVWPLFADRELRKRMYVALKAINPDCRLVAHTSSGVGPWTASFYDAYVAGEEWEQFKGGAGTGDAIDRFALEKFAAEYKSAKLGVPSLSISFIYSGSSGYPGDAVARPLTEAFLALTLIHDAGALNYTAEVDQGTMMRWWDVQDAFGMDDVAFYGYWADSNMVSVTNTNLKVSMYVKNDLSRAMLIVANLGSTAVTDTITMNLNSLGVTQVTEAKEAYVHDVVTWSGDNHIGLTVPQHNFRVVFLTFVPRGDANYDHRVNVVDLGILATNYGLGSGATWSQGDFNGDGKVNIVDLGILATNYGAGSGSSKDIAAQGGNLTKKSIGLKDTNSTSNSGSVIGLPCAGAVTILFSIIAQAFCFLSGFYDEHR